MTEDVRLACKKHGTRANEQELTLYDVYAENTKNMMNKDRRILNLTRWRDWFAADMAEQAKARHGLEKFRSFALTNPNFSANNEADVELKLRSVDLLHTLFEASQHKVQSALAELLLGGDAAGAKPPPPPQQQQVAKFANMATTYDRQGVPSTILKLLDSAPILSSSVNMSTAAASASAPSPPDSPQARLRSATLASMSSSNSSSNTNASTPNLLPTACSNPGIYSNLNNNINNQQILHMPVPIHIAYNSLTNSYEATAAAATTTTTTTAAAACSVTNNYAGGNSSTVSSVSPAALSSSSSASSCSYSALPLITTTTTSATNTFASTATAPTIKTNPNKSCSLLLKAAYNSNERQQQQSSSALSVLALKKSITLLSHNNNNNNQNDHDQTSGNTTSSSAEMSLAINGNGMMAGSTGQYGIENYYNNSNNSVSDGKRTYLI